MTATTMRLIMCPRCDHLLKQRGDDCDCGLQYVGALTRIKLRDGMFAVFYPADPCTAIYIRPQDYKRPTDRIDHYHSEWEDWNAVRLPGLLWTITLERADKLSVLQ